MKKNKTNKQKKSISILTLDAASTCVSEPPSSAASRVDGASALRPPVQVCDAAGSGAPWASAVSKQHQSQGGDV